MKIEELAPPAGILSRPLLLPVREDGYRGGEDVEKFTVGDVDEKDETWYHMDVPKGVRIQFYISEELG